MGNADHPSRAEGAAGAETRCGKCNGTGLVAHEYVNGCDCRLAETTGNRVTITTDTPHVVMTLAEYEALRAAANSRVSAFDVMDRIREAMPETGVLSTWGSALNALIASREEYRSALTRATADREAAERETEQAYQRFDIACTERDAATAARDRLARALDDLADAAHWQPDATFSLREAAQKARAALTGETAP
jgi:hypothetical protein